MPGTTTCTLTKGFRREQIWKLWFKLCDYLNVVRFSDLIWNLIYWYSRTVLTLSIIVWHFHNFEAVYPFISNCLLEIKSCISASSNILGRKSKGNLDAGRKFCFLFKLFMFVEDPPKEDDKEKAVEKEEGWVWFHFIHVSIKENKINISLKGPLFIILSYFKPHCFPFSLTSF